MTRPFISINQNSFPILIPATQITKPYYSYLGRFKRAQLKIYKKTTIYPNAHTPIRDEIETSPKQSRNEPEARSRRGNSIIFFVISKFVFFRFFFSEERSLFAPVIIRYASRVDDFDFELKSMILILI